MSPGPKSRRTAALLAAIALLTLALYAPSLANGFAMDDTVQACATLPDGRRNEMVGTLRPLRRYFETNYHQGAGHLSELYRPITVLSYALVNAAVRSPDRQLQALPHHLLNVLLHVLATLAVFGLLRAVPLAPVPAAAGALVFGVHALHSEAVAGIVGRAELLAFVFGAAATLVLYRAVAGRGVGRPALALAAAMLLFLAFGSKESALAWAGFAPLLVVRCRRDLRLAVLAVVPPVLVFLALRQSMLAGLPAAPPVAEYLVNPLAHTAAGTRVLTALMLWGLGLAKTVLPFGLCADYGATTFALVGGPADPRLWAALGGLLALAGAGVALGQRHRPWLLAAAAFFGFGLVTSNVPFAIGTVFGERLYYAPSLALSLLVAWLAGSLRSRQVWPGMVLLAVWVAWSGALVLERNPVWRNDEVLFVHEVRHNPDSVRLLVCAAGIERGRGRLDCAAELLRRATDRLPDYALGWNNLADVRLAQGRPADAEAALRRGLRARWQPRGADCGMLHETLAQVLDALGRGGEAERERRLAASLRAAAPGR